MYHDLCNNAIEKHPFR